MRSQLEEFRKGQFTSHETKKNLLRRRTARRQVIPEVGETASTETGERRTEKSRRERRGPKKRAVKKRRPKKVSGSPEVRRRNRRSTSGK